MDFFDSQSQLRYFRLLTFLKSLVSWLSTESVNLSFGLSFQISFFLVLTPMMSGCSSIWTLSKQTPGQVYQKGSKIIFWMFMVIQNQIILVWLLTSWKQVSPETDICKVSLKWCLDLSMNWLFSQMSQLFVAGKMSLSYSDEST